MKIHGMPEPAVFSLLKPACLIFMFALSLRLIYFFQVKDEFLFNTPIIDAAVYNDWAMEIVKNHDWLSISRGVFVMSPGYPYFLAFLYSLFSTSTTLVVWIQFLLGCLTSILIGLMTQKIFSNTRMGILAGLLYAGYGLSIFFEGTLLKASLLNFLNTLFLCTFLLSKRTWATMIAGILLGCSVQLRPNILVLVPIALIWLLLYRKETFLKEMLFFVLGLSLVLASVAYRNYRVGGEWVLTTAHGGITFYVGNNSSSSGPYTPLSFARQDPEIEPADYHSEAEKRVGRRLTWGETSKFWWRETFKFIKEQPFSWLRLMLIKTVLFWNAYEPSGNLDYNFFKAELSSILSWPLVSWGIIAPLGLLGLVMSFRRTKELLFLACYLLVYFFLNVAFFTTDEYRFPAVIVLLPCAAFIIFTLIDITKKRQGRKIFALLVSAACLFWFVNKDVHASWFSLSTYKESKLANDYFNLGVIYQTHRDFDKAILSYEKGMKIQPQEIFFVNLATIYYERKEPEIALMMIERALQINPSRPEAYFVKGFIELERGNFNSATNYFQRGSALDPNSERTKYYNDLFRKKLGFKSNLLTMTRLKMEV